MRVYNMSVENDHVYFVGDLTTLTHNNGCAASQLPPMKGSTHTAIRGELEDGGFSMTKKTNNAAGNETWQHADGSEVRIHPYGNQSQTPYKTGNNAHIHKQDPQGNQLNDRGLIDNNRDNTHIGISNPPNLPQVRGRPHGS